MTPRQQARLGEICDKSAEAIALYGGGKEMNTICPNALIGLVSIVLVFFIIRLVQLLKEKDK